MSMFIWGLWDRTVNKKASIWVTWTQVPFWVKNDGSDPLFTSRVWLIFSFSSVCICYILPTRAGFLWFDVCWHFTAEECSGSSKPRREHCALTASRSGSKCPRAKQDAAIRPRVSPRECDLYNPWATMVAIKQQYSQWPFCLFVFGAPF